MTQDTQAEALQDIAARAAALEACFLSLAGAIMALATQAQEMLESLRVASSDDPTRDRARMDESVDRIIAAFDGESPGCMPDESRRCSPVGGQGSPTVVWSELFERPDGRAPLRTQE